MNRYLGKNSGTAKTNNGVTISENFDYDKIKNILIAKKSKIIDKINNIIIYSDKLHILKMMS